MDRNFKSGHIANSDTPVRTCIHPVNTFKPKPPMKHESSAGAKFLKRLIQQAPPKPKELTVILDDCPFDTEPQQTRKIVKALLKKGNRR